MNFALTKPLIPKNLDYIIVNQDFLVLEISDGVLRFAELLGFTGLQEDLRIYLSELVGSENTFETICQGKQENFELKSITKLTPQGNLVYLDLHILKYIDKDTDDNHNLIIFFEDVTAKKQLSQEYQQLKQDCNLLVEQLSASQAYLNTVLASISEILLVITPSGIIKDINQATTNLLGYGKSELIGQSTRIIFSERTHDFLSRQGKESSHCSCSQAMNLLCKTKNGDKLRVSFSCFQIQSGVSNQFDFVYIGRNITKQREAELFQQKQAQQQNLLRIIMQQIRQSLQLEEILRTTVQQVRQFLNCERVFIYRYLAHGQGRVVVESLAEGGTSLEGQTFNPSSCLQERYLNSYRQGTGWAISNIIQKNIEPEHIDMLVQFQVKAELAIPIVNGEEVWGLLVAHHCCQPRCWKPWELDLIKQLNEELAIAINQAELYQKLQDKNRELLRLATLDELTQLSNRRHFNQYVYKEWRRLAREEKSLSLIMCDVDHFKLYNDTYGHLDGDFCLQRVASVLQTSIKRPADLAARYGGEEFAIILPNTSADGAVELAQKICERVHALQIPHEKSSASDYVTLSMGVASRIPQPRTEPETLVNEADRALYQAKEQGRNRVIKAIV